MGRLSGVRGGSPWLLTGQIYMSNVGQNRPALVVAWDLQSESESKYMEYCTDISPHSPLNFRQVICISWRFSCKTSSYSGTRQSGHSEIRTPQYRGHILPSKYYICVLFNP